MAFVARRRARLGTVRLPRVQQLSKPHRTAMGHAAGAGPPGGATRPDGDGGVEH